MTDSLHFAILYSVLLLSGAGLIASLLFVVYLQGELTRCRSILQRERAQNLSTWQQQSSEANPYFSRLMLDAEATKMLYPGQLSANGVVRAKSS